MAKALGLIGNFKGKLGNTVGYSLKDSNNMQTQGVRVYQPVVRNPKTAAQAEQRCKLAPINATYRALKMVIDRGQEGKAYGNKSRLAWLKDALTNFDGYYFAKGENPVRPAIVPITNGSLPNPLRLGATFEELSISMDSIPSGGFATIGAFSTALLNQYKSLKEGQQISFVGMNGSYGTLQARVRSIVIDTTNTDALPTWIFRRDECMVISLSLSPLQFAAIIISEEGDNGSHLRSREVLSIDSTFIEDRPLNMGKDAAIESYMSQGANTDWAEESLM